MTCLLQQGAMKESMSPWGANNVVVSKKDSDIWVTTEFRPLNSVTETNAYPMQDMQMTLD